MDVLSTEWAAIGRRVRALRRAAGYANTQALARDLQLPRFGYKTLGEVERGKRQLFPHELEEIARVLKVDPQEIQAPVQQGTQLDRIEEKLDSNARLLETILAKLGVTDWEQVEDLHVPGFDEGLAELLRPPGDTPPHSATGGA